MSCEKESWPQQNASQRNNYSASGDNPRPSFAEPTLFLEQAGNNLRTYKRGEDSLLLVTTSDGDLRLRAVYETGVQLFDITHPGLEGGARTLESRNWIISGRHLFDSGLGVHIGSVDITPNDIFESSSGDVVFMCVVENEDLSRNYEFYLIDLDEFLEPQASLLWVTDQLPFCYYSETDNLLFPEAGESRQLLTGELQSTFPPLGDLTPSGVDSTLYAGFDREGNAYISYRESAGSSQYMAKMKKLSFSFPPSGPATQEWDVDLSQYLHTRNGSSLWANNNPLYPRNVAITKDYVWFIQGRLFFQYVYQDGFQFGDPESAKYNPWFDSHGSEWTIVRLRTSDGTIAQTQVVPGTESTTYNPGGSFRLWAADAEDEDWAIAYFQTIPEGDTVEEVYSQLFLLQGHETVLDLLKYEVSYDEENNRITSPQLLTETMLPHEELGNALILGGNLYYNHLEEDDTVSVRRLGLHYRCDEKRRYRGNGDPCQPPGTVNLIGDIKFSAGNVGHLQLTYSSCDRLHPPLSMGYGWYLDAYKKLLISSTMLEFIDGSGGYEQWELFNDEFVPVHKDNFVKAVANNDDTYELTFPDYSKMLFDEYGRVQTWTDRSSNTITYIYEETDPEEEAAARLIEMNDGHGRKTIFEYATSALSDRQPSKIVEVERGNLDDEGRETKLFYDSSNQYLRLVEDPNGDVTEYQYSLDGRLHKVIEPGNRVALEYTYNEDGQVETETVNGVMRRTYDYDLERRKTTITLSDLEENSPGRVVSYEYDIIYNVIKETDPLGNVTTTEYKDPRHPKLVTAKIDPNWNVSKFGYNKLGNLRYTIDAQGHRTDFEYAEDIGPSGERYRNLLRKVKRPLVAGESERFETVFNYDSLGRLQTVVDAKGKTTTLSYGSYGVVDSIINRRGKTTNFVYESNNSLRLKEIHVPTGRSTGDIVTTFQYDGFDNVTKVFNGLGDYVETQYDSIGRPEIVWDPLRNQTAYHYEDGLLEEIDLPPNVASVSTARTVRMTYDAAARLQKVERAIGGSTMQTRVSYGYDGFSQLRQLVRLKDSTSQTYEFTYDRLGRQTSVKDPRNKVSTTAYERFCKRYAETSARGVRRKMSFDNLCRLTQIDVGDPGSGGMAVLPQRETRRFKYDELGRMTESQQGRTASFGSRLYSKVRYGGMDVSGDGGVRKYEYDELDLLTKVIFEDESWVSYLYDDESNLIQMTESAGTGSPRVTKYEYYDDNLLRKVIIERPSQDDRVFEYFYDEIGRLERIVYPEESEIEALFDDGNSNSGWDKNGRLKFLRYEKNGSEIRKLEFDYDDSGNLTLQINTTPTSETRWEYGYDWLDRLSTVRKGLNGGAVATVSIYAYDESDNRTGWSLPQETIEYVYSYGAADNITSRQKKVGGTTEFTETFGVDDDGNVIWRERPVDGDPFRITYQWDDFNKLVAVGSTLDGIPTNDVKQESLYGTNGFRRRKKDKNGTFTLEYADGLATAVAKSTSTVTYLMGHQLMGFERDGDFFYYLTDHLGSVRDIVSGTDGAVLQSYEYRENGEKTTLIPSGPKSDKTWIGGLSVNDDVADSGLYLMGHRHFDSTQGRFLSRDPIGFAGGLNLYSYGNSPVQVVDPAGLRGGSFIEGKTGTPAPNVPLGQADLNFAVGAFTIIGLAEAAPGAVAAGGYLLFRAGLRQAGARMMAMGSLEGAAGGAAVAGASGGVYGATNGSGGLRNPCGGPLSRGASQGIRVSPKGYNLVRNHLNNMDEYPPNQVMLRRLASARDSGQRIHGGDANFYLHEASEATMMNRGLGYDAAHQAALQKYGVHDFAVYPREVVQKMSEWFNRGFLNYGG